MEGRRDLSDIILLLKYCGYFNNTNGTLGTLITFSQLLRVILSGTATIMAGTSMYLTGIKESLPRFAFFFFCGTVLTTQAGYLWINRKIVVQTILLLKKFTEKRNEPKQTKFFKKISTPIWLALKLLIAFCFVFQICYYFLPLGYDAYLAFYTNSTEPFTMPIPNKGLLGNELPSRTIPFYFIEFFIIIWSYSLSAYTIGYHALLFPMVLYTCSELKVISDSILSWGKLCNKNDFLFERDSTLKCIIQDHQQVLKLVDAVREVIGFPALLNIVLGPVALTLFLFTVAVQLKKNFVLMLLNLTCVICVTVLLFTGCLVGEILQIQSLKIFESFCETPWYEMPPTLRVQLNMIIRQAARPMTIHYKRRGNLNLQAFMQIINSSYSYFMLLNSLR